MAANTMPSDGHPGRFRLEGFHQGVDSDDLEGPLKVVAPEARIHFGHGMQHPFAEQVTAAGPVLEGAEGMFGQRGPLANHLGGFVHPLLDFIDDFLVNADPQLADLLLGT